MKPGKIRIIDNKVKFEPDGLEHPHKRMASLIVPNKRTKIIQHKAMKEYEASKQLIKVDNIKGFHGQFYEYYVFSDIGGIAKDGLPCKAEITNNIATIVELIK